MRVRVQGDEHPHTLLCKANLGFCLTALGSPAEAVSLLAAAAAALHSTLNPSHTASLFATGAYADALRADGELEALMGGTDATTFRETMNVFKALENFYGLDADEDSKITWDEFVAVFGYSPSKAVIFNTKCEEVYNFGEAPRNTVRRAHGPPPTHATAATFGSRTTAAASRCVGHLTT